ncbi:MAG: adenylate/guanylate cyclase domain-containing protein [Nitrososphaerota archaeon]
MSITSQTSMSKLIQTVFASDKFQKTIRDGDVGYFDIQEKVFVPSKFVPVLIKEITHGPSIILGSNKMDDYFFLCQVRIKRALATRFRTEKAKNYKQTISRYISKEFLKLHANSTINFAALYVDLVGSTLMSMKLSSEHLSTLISIFTQEMASLVSIHHGYVLKYAGDAVIAFFPETESFSKMCYDALNCAVAMNNIVHHGINRAIIGAGFEPLNIRIGIEAGSNKIMLIGGDIDIIGFNMNIAAKVQSMARPGHIGIGQQCYAALDEESQSKFVQLDLGDSWKYKDSEGNHYKLYEYQEQEEH